MTQDNNNIQLTADEEKKGYMVIATKVSPSSAYLIRKICERVGIKPYRLMQHVLSCMVRYMDERHNLDPQLTQLIELFFTDLGKFKEKYNMCDPGAQTAITNALFFLGDHKHHDGRQSVLVTPEQKGKDGIPFPPQEDWNVQHQLEYFLQQSDFYLYKKIRQAGAKYGVKSTYDMLQRIAEEVTECDTMSEEIRQLFLDNDRSEYGKKPADQPYKRHPNRIPRDMFTGQEPSADLKAEQARKMERDMGCRPFGYEV